jgi:hypothetical protein
MYFYFQPPAGGCFFTFLLNPEKSFYYFLIPCSCPIYRAPLKTADESANYKRMYLQNNMGLIQSHFSG